MLLGCSQYEARRELFKTKCFFRRQRGARKKEIFGMTANCCWIKWREELRVTKTSASGMGDDDLCIR